VPAYVIAIVTEAHDDAALAEYRRRNTAAVEAVEVLEGDWDPLRVVVMAFADIEAARGWYTSEAYEAAKPLRLGASTTQLIVVDGVR
jgi:uncharacterized protein (DUF1330 family)